MATSNIQNYFLVKEAIIDHPSNYSIYLHAQYYFKEEGQTVLILYDRLWLYRYSLYG